MIRRNLLGLACLAVMATGLTAKALMIAPPPIGMRVATAHAALVGKVLKFGDKMVPAEMFKGDERQMQIAVVKVEESLIGKPGKEIKVGFFPPVATPGGGGVIGRPIRRFPTAQLQIGQEALMLLTPHPTKKDVLVINDFFSVVNKKDNPNFAKELAEVKKSAKLLANPSAGLRSKDADERFLTTALVITRYRTPSTPDAKTETVSAEESKLLLTNLADADWAPRGGRFGFQMTPMNLFFRLGLTEKDGWKPMPRTNVQEAARQWLKDNAGKYRVVRYVRPDAGTSVEP